jgi:hypothetical protein
MPWAAYLVAKSSARLDGATQVPRPFVTGSGWEAFYTAQHGDNVTYRLIRDHIGQ